MLARCPNCRNTFSTERTGPQDCPVCGKPLVVPEVATAAPAAAPTSGPEGAPATGEGTPWERRDELGFWTAWGETVAQALFEPGKLFRAARLDRGAAQAGFAVLTAGSFWIVGQLLDRFFLGAQRERLLNALRARGQLSPVLEKILQATNQNSPRTALLVTLATPLAVFLLVYLSAAVTHAAALLLGQAKRGFAATFAACAYACAPLVLLAIPGCGGLAGAIWTAVLTGVGLKETHRIGAGGAAAAVFAPYLLLCCAICAATALATSAFLRGMPQ